LKLKYKLIYICPERLGLGKESTPADQAFLSILKNLYDVGKLDRFILDEIHCVKSWGETFRKDYGLLEHLKDIFNETPILGLTATASKKTKHQLLKKLKMDTNFCLFQNSMDRPNLRYIHYPSNI
jgi:bloom syndrome protein